MRRRRVYRDTAVVGGWVPPSRRILQFQRIWVGAVKPTSSGGELSRDSILHRPFGTGVLRQTSSLPSSVNFSWLKRSGVVSEHSDKNEESVEWVIAWGWLSLMGLVSWARPAFHCCCRSSFFFPEKVAKLVDDRVIFALSV